MNYRETQQWEKDGSFSGDVVGVGSFGLGLGMGSGSYSETGTMATKRAATFEEPQPYQLPYASVVFFGIGLAVALSLLPKIAEFMLAQGGASYAHNGIAKLKDAYLYILPGVSVIAVTFLLINSWNRAEANRKREEKLNAEVYPKQLKRYNELLYCESCHCLFDGKGNSEDANQLGFHRMMQIGV